MIGAFRISAQQYAQECLQRLYYATLKQKFQNTPPKSDRQFFGGILLQQKNIGLSFLTNPS